MALRVLLTGGGTGGHAYPIVAVAQEIKRQIPEAQFLWVGSKTGPERGVAGQAEIAYSSGPTGKLRRYFSWRTLLDLLLVPFGVIKAWLVVAAFKPHVVFSKGGFVSYQVVFASWLLDLPILLHETDNVPGLARSEE